MAMAMVTQHSMTMTLRKQTYYTDDDSDDGLSMTTSNSSTSQPVSLTERKLKAKALCKI
jgi:hypothetical protein